MYIFERVKQRVETSEKTLMPINVNVVNGCLV
jgi:hypothetical protein